MGGPVHGREKWMVEELAQSNSKYKMLRSEPPQGKEAARAAEHVTG